jgi:hypothetical protein
MCYISSTTIDPCDCRDENVVKTAGQQENDSLLASCPPAEFELDAWAGEIPLDLTTSEVGQVADTNLRLAGEYRAAGHTALAEECRQAAIALYDRWAQLFVAEMLGPHK